MESFCTSQILQYTIEKDQLNEIQDFSKIIKKDSKPKNWKRKISETILVKKLRPTL